MGDKSSIEWTEATWNPTVGCNRVSPGCVHCYAELMAARIAGAAQAALRAGKKLTPIQEAYRLVVRWERGGKTPADADDKALPRWNGEVVLVAEQLGLPLRWTRPRRVFVNSMSDLFHERLPFEAIAAVFGVMAAAPQHSFQVLTKRPERALEFFGWVEAKRPALTAELVKQGGAWPKTDEYSAESALCAYCAREVLEPGDLSPFAGWPLPNVWLGVSAEDQTTADQRIPLLLQCPAAVRFVSYEPALGPISWRWSKWDDWSPHPRRKTQSDPVIRGGRPQAGAVDQFDGLRMLDWIIVGGESGPGARPFDVSWARETVRQCREAGVACFVKQLGRRPQLTFTHPAGEDARPYLEAASRGIPSWPPSDPKGGDWTEWPADLRVREFPA